MHWYNHLLVRDFSSFIEKTLATVDPAATYAPNWHIDVIAEHLEAARRGDITRLIINMPPRMLKSQCVSIAWPAWILGHDPRARIMAASYSQTLSVKHSLDCRQIITSDWYQNLFPNTQLARDQNEKHKFQTTKRGFRFATSVGGTATGEGGNFLIIDDPMSAAQGMNLAAREQVKRWYDHTFSTRLNDKKHGVIVLVMQRLHVDDLTAHLLSKGGFVHLSLPAISTQKDVHRDVGEPLHPAREDAILLERAKMDLGSQGFSAQYQQQPLPDDGGMVKRAWFARYSELPVSDVRIIQSWDTAIKSSAQHDASVCITCLEYANNYYVVDVRVVRLEYPDLKRLCVRMAEEFLPHVVLIEDKASGQQLLQDLKRETSLPLIAVMSSTNKITRFAAVSAIIESGRVYLPHHASWLSAFEDEILQFPHGKHDDQVDALTQFLDFMRKSSLRKLTIRRI